MRCRIASTRTNGSSSSTYVYGRSDRNGVPMIQSFTKNGQTSYIDYDPTGSPIALQGPGATTDYYALDNQGTPVNLVNNAGAATAMYTYDPAGKQLTATGTSATANPLRYTQGLLDEDTSWLKHGVRLHDTTTANWTAQDPLSQLMTPDAASRYAYASGNPRNFIDPTGRDDVDDLADNVNRYADLFDNYGGLALGVTGAIYGGIAGSAGTPAGTVVGAGIGAGIGYGVGTAVGKAFGTVYGTVDYFLDK